LIISDYSKLLKTKTGTLIGVPIPEKYEEKSKRIQEAVEQAVRESEENGIATRGKEVTPWILAKVKELSGGESVESSKFQVPIHLSSRDLADVLSTLLQTSHSLKTTQE
jgi:pseudouridine-5'-phosphate glycosidase